MHQVHTQNFSLEGGGGGAELDAVYKVWLILKTVL
jgi:hypothetical protein